jgi:type II secretory ATPase GspE/PulE/Tfp pilus assembly ATPase PilB-like protein
VRSYHDNYLPESIRRNRPKGRGWRTTEEVLPQPKVFLGRLSGKYLLDYDLYRRALTYKSSSESMASLSATDTPSLDPAMLDQAVIDAHQVFGLIDRILPFEACLYHQVLPLRLEDDRLTLAMVNLDDVAALEYVQRMLGYMNYSLAPQTILAQTHHSILSAFLTHQQAQKNASATPSLTVLPKPEDPNPLHQRPTLVLNEQDALTDWTIAPEDPITVIPQTLKPTYLIIDEEPSTPEEVPVVPPSEVPIAPPANQTPPDSAFPGSALPQLELNAPLSDRPLLELPDLPAPELLQELLNRALSSGVGRLHFEAYNPDDSAQTQGRILWSENGVLQSVISDVSPELLQDLICQLKMMLHLPLNQVTEPVQAEIERQYQKQRVLLRLRVIPAHADESATLQVLRGAALKFYQQQQLKTLSRDTLEIARHLNQKIQELSDRLRTNPDPANLTPEFTQLIETMEQQLNTIKKATHS